MPGLFFAVGAAALIMTAIYLFRMVVSSGRRLEMLRNASAGVLVTCGAILAMGFSLTDDYDTKETPRESVAASPNPEVNSPSEIKETYHVQETDSDDCGDETQCIIDEYKIDAEVACNPRIESLANYTHRWVNAWYEPRYTHFAVDLEIENSLTMFGDAIEFQNGFSAWQRSSYVCVYDYESGVVITVDAQPGRLDL